MKKPLSKKAKTLLIILGLLLLIGTCCLCVALYAKKIINTPKFEVPEPAPLASATPLPEGDAEGLAYIEKLFGESFAKGAEVTFRTDISVPSDSISSDASGADTNIIKFMSGQLLGSISENYTSYSNTRGDLVKNVPLFTLSAAELDDIELTQGRTDDKGEIQDEDFYFFNIDASAEAAKAGKCVFVTENDKAAYESFKKQLASAFVISDEDFELFESKIEGKIDRVYDQLVNISFSRAYHVKAVITPAADSGISEIGKITISFDFKASDKFDFRRYGARFTEKALYFNPGDFETLPAQVTVADGTEQNEFEIKYTVSDDTVAEVDADGVITALKASETPVKVTMTFKYNGMTFTDECSVTVTDLEVKK